jgi:uncharacterized protein YbjT (DUF2867 family)
MKVILFGATGMVGQGVLRECLLDPGVERVLSVGRSATRQAHPKLVQHVHTDFTDFSADETQLAGYDACFFCLGVSSAGMKEADYRRVTNDYALAAARTLAKVSPGMTFIYVSGAGTDSSAKGSSMWARVKGETENAILDLPFRSAYMFRPAFIQPLHGITSRTTLYRVLYSFIRPLVPVIKALSPKWVTTTEQVGIAMLSVARKGFPTRVLENWEIDGIRRSAF